MTAPVTGRIHPGSDPLLLTPKELNYHELWVRSNHDEDDAGDGPAAFLDILAPPYSSGCHSEEEQVRDCFYYEVRVVPP